MLKKFLKANLGLVLTAPSLLLVSCGNNETSIIFNDMNNFIAYQNVFTYTDEQEQKHKFELLPQEIDQSENEQWESQPAFIVGNDNYLRLNCERYICSSLIFEGNPLTYDQYNKLYDNDYKETTKVQFSYDYLAKTFNLNISDPNTTEEKVFYDFSSTSIEVDVEKNTYYYDQYKQDEELILISNQDIEFAANDVSSSKIDFYDQNEKLTIQYLKELTNNETLTFNETSNEIVGTITQENQKNIFLQIFSHFDSTLNFIVDELEETNENETQKSWTATFKKEFKMDNTIIKSIKLNLEQTNEDGGK
ncbi:hypothetical protein [Spiroplasma culicicola]|uniref:Lipoprotein n=1 Tax=Spiroplasma culicicola AES-1 TaxID=1276246 RepID=W6A7N6_9MOLU|nr:hypothetical protein [Spiroplasma culicicola]AHI52875.1 hypothetical protein SCULI_v1c05340 [Spiroplasma culicicola AES-1]